MLLASSATRALIRATRDSIASRSSSAFVVHIDWGRRKRCHVTYSPRHSYQTLSCQAMAGSDLHSGAVAVAPEPHAGQQPHESAPIAQSLEPAAVLLAQTWAGSSAQVKAPEEQVIFVSRWAVGWHKFLLPLHLYHQPGQRQAGPAEDPGRSERTKSEPLLHQRYRHGRQSCGQIARMYAPASMTQQVLQLLGWLEFLDQTGSLVYRLGTV